MLATGFERLDRNGFAEARTMNSELIQTFGLIFVIAVYVLSAYPIYVMGQKTDSDHAWFAFVPILNLVLLLEIAGKDLWWLILFLIPCIGLIVWIIVWMAVAEEMDKPSWVGVLMLIPVVSFF